MTLRKLITFFLIAVSAIGVSAQQVVLYSEDFENGPSAFLFNQGGPGANTGNNQWVVNDSFTGQPFYPNTPNEDSVVLGQITDAPYSHYLHIHDVTTTQVANDNWNTSSASRNFTYTSTGFCTLGMTNVILTFYWICEGDTTAGAYGQVYYSANGGAWTQTGQAKYAGQSKWQYESIQDPGMTNVQNLQIGFRWVNPSTTDSTDVAFGIDDIVMVGNYDSINNPASIDCAVLDDTICQGGQQVFYMALSEPLCDGTYEIEMSNSTGSFASPTNLGILSLGPTFTDGYFGTLGTNGNLSGNCFELRIVRLSPLPVIISDTSTCFSIVPCPNEIFNLMSPVMTDVDTTCILSELDIMFNSIGVFHSGNTYIAQLSDSTGSFADSTILGTLPVTDSFPSMPPGDVSGLIPASVPPGCGYYIRIVSTNPYTVSAPIGPYCLKDCDVLSNNHTDVHFCINSGPYPQCDTLFNIKPHEWNGHDDYDTCNKWEVQLLDMMTFSIVNTGGIAIYHDTVGGNFILCVPGNVDSLPVAPGEYYMRIISTCSNEPWDSTGTVIRITIGAPSSTPSTLSISPKDTVCNTAVIYITANPFNDPPSQYQWSSNLLNNGNSFIWPYNPLGITLNSSVPFGVYTFYVQEINYGCVGPFSAPLNVTIIGVPKVNITGPATICLGDTVAYDVTHLADTYYDWTIPSGVQPLDTGGNQALLIFDTLGTFTISNFSINTCGSDNGNYKVKVISPYVVSASVQPQPVCEGQQATLVATANSRHLVFTTDTTAISGAQGAMFNLIAHDSVIIDSFAVKYLTHPASVFSEIYVKKGTYIGNEQDQAAWDVLDVNQNVIPAPVGKMTIIPDELDLPIGTGDTVGFYVTTANTSPVVDEGIISGTGINQGVVYASDGVIDFVQGTQNTFSFGTFLGPKVLDVRVYYTTQAGMKYIWSNGDTTPIVLIKPTQTTQYVVQVYDTSGCRNVDSITVVVDSVPSVNAGPDTSLCAGVTYVMNATASTVQNLTWSPATGLSATNILDPTFQGKQSSTYVLTAGYADGCNASDTMNIHVKQIQLNPGPDTTICDGETYIMQATSSATDISWSPGTGLSNTNTLNPTFSNPQSVTYTLSATDSDCTVSDTVAINVMICSTYIQAPEAFSPNGDGVNDFYTVYGKYISTYEIRIFNRWGQEVYSSNDVSELNNLSRGWDGTYKGKKEDPGVFAYLIEATDINGKKIQKKGNLTLLR